MLPGFTLPCFAKINWTLRILGKHNDGFHEILTVFQTVSLHDSLIFGEGNEVRLTCNYRYLPTDGRNLIMKAATALQQKFSVSKGASIHLEKRIPSPGGLGGGSADAAGALIGLKRLWQIDCSIQELREIAAGIGSDVPFFLYGGTALGMGRGEVIESVDDLSELYLLIVTPNVRVSTRVAFAGLAAPTLTNEALDHNLSVCRLEARSLDLRHSALINDFEKSVFDAFPEIGRVKNTLLELGAVNAALSGSGASVFAVFDKEETRQAAQKALEQESTWRKFAVSTVSRSEYREALRC